MTVIGVLLILVAAVLLLIGLLAGADASTTLSLGGVDISMTAMGVFLMGAATVLIFVSGLEMLRSGLRRSMRRRRELKEARAVVAERERSERETGTTTADAGATAPGATEAGTTGSPSTPTGTTPATGTGTSGTSTAETGATSGPETAGSTETTDTGRTETGGTTDDAGPHAR